MWRADICIALGSYCCFYYYLPKQNLTDEINSSLRWCLFTQRACPQPLQGCKEYLRQRIAGLAFCFVFQSLNALLSAPQWSFPPFTLPGQRQQSSERVPPWHSRHGDSRPPHPLETRAQSGGPAAGSPRGGTGKELMSSLLPTNENFRAQGSSEHDLSSSGIASLGFRCSAVSPSSVFLKHLSLLDRLLLMKAGRLKTGMFSLSSTALCYTHRSQHRTHRSTMLAVKSVDLEVRPLGIKAQLCHCHLLASGLWASLSSSLHLSFLLCEMGGIKVTMPRAITRIRRNDPHKALSIQHLDSVVSQPADPFNRVSNSNGHLIPFPGLYGSPSPRASSFFLSFF